MRDPDPALTRYAVLHHTGVPVPHFDVLVEPRPGGDLAAWRSSAWPVHGTAAVERIKDHRRAYLDHEGEVGGGRGSVERVAGGICSVAIGADGVWTVALASGSVGVVTLRPVDGAAWEMSG